MLRGVLLQFACRTPLKGCGGSRPNLQRVWIQMSTLGGVAMQRAPDEVKLCEHGSLCHDRSRYNNVRETSVAQKHCTVQHGSRTVQTNLQSHLSQRSAQQKIKKHWLLSASTATLTLCMKAFRAKRNVGLAMSGMLT